MPLIILMMLKSLSLSLLKLVVFSALLCCLISADDVGTNAWTRTAQEYLETLRTIQRYYQSLVIRRFGTDQLIRQLGNNISLFTLVY